jgi:hypothetical protein
VIPVESLVERASTVKLYMVCGVYATFQGNGTTLG